MRQAFDDALQRGLNASRLNANDAEALASAGVELLPDGNVSLVAQSSQKVQREPATGRVVATMVTPSSDPARVETQVENALIVEEDPVSIDSEPGVELNEEATRTIDSEPRIELVQEDTPIVQLPDGVFPGAVLQISSPVGQIIHLTVPDGAYPGCFLVVEGVVEVRVPKNAAEGDVMNVPLPDDTSVPVAISAQGSRPGSLVAIGYPISVKDPPSFAPEHSPRSTS